MKFHWFNINLKKKNTQSRYEINSGRGEKYRCENNLFFKKYWYKSKVTIYIYLIYTLKFAFIGLYKQKRMSKLTFVSFCVHC